MLLEVPLYSVWVVSLIDGMWEWGGDNTCVFLSCPKYLGGIRPSRWWGVHCVVLHHQRNNEPEFEGASFRWRWPPADDPHLARLRSREYVNTWTLELQVWVIGTKNGLVPKYSWYKGILGTKKRMVLRNHLYYQIASANNLLVLKRRWY
jgi:hypothetical protein